MWLYTDGMPDHYLIRIEFALENLQMQVIFIDQLHMALTKVKLQA